MSNCQGIDLLAINGNIFWTSLEIFGRLRKSSDIFCYSFPTKNLDTLRIKMSRLWITKSSQVSNHTLVAFFTKLKKIISDPRNFLFNCCFNRKVRSWGSEWRYLNNTLHLILGFCNIKQLNFRHFNTNSKKFTVTIKISPRKKPNPLQNCPKTARRSFERFRGEFRKCFDYIPRTNSYFIT